MYLIVYSQEVKVPNLVPGSTVNPIYDSSPNKRTEQHSFLFFDILYIFYPPRKLKYTIGAFAFAIQDPQAPLPGYHETDSPKAGVIYHFQLSIDPVLIVCDAPEEAWLSGFVVVFFALNISSKNGWCCQLPVQ